MEADGRLVEDEERSGERGTQRGREPRALRLAPRERACLAIEREVPEPDALQVPEPRRERRLDPRALRRRHRLRLHARPCLRDGEGVPRREIEIADAVRARDAVEPAAVARLAERVLAVAREEHAHVHLVGAPLEPLEPRANAGEFAAFPGPFAVEHQALLGLREDGPRHIHGDLRALAELHQRAALPLRAVAVPRFDGALRERLVGVGDDLVPVDADDAAEALAVSARAER